MESQQTETLHHLPEGASKYQRMSRAAQRQGVQNTSPLELEQLFIWLMQQTLDHRRNQEFKLSHSCDDDIDDSHHVTKYKKKNDEEESKYEQHNRIHKVDGRTSFNSVVQPSIHKEEYHRRKSSKKRSESSSRSRSRSPKTRKMIRESSTKIRRTNHDD